MYPMHEPSLLQPVLIVSVLYVQVGSSSKKVKKHVLVFTCLLCYSSELVSISILTSSFDLVFY